VAKKKTISDAEKALVIADQAVAIADFAAKALLAADQLDIKGMPVENFPLHKAEREFLSKRPTVSVKFKKKLRYEKAAYTVAEVASLTIMTAESLLDAKPLEQVKLLMVIKALMDCLKDNIVLPAEPAKKRKSKSANALYQFKITLVGPKPAIWRRIQVKDCTLDKLHQHIQTTMGWTNSHLHHFRINKKHYGNPKLLGDTFGELDYQDSTTTLLSAIVPNNGKRFRFAYEYDFGDSWDHEVLFEGCPKVETGRQYPYCVEGERACPPEDVGGVFGYEDFVEVIQNEDHEQHKEMLEWVGGVFDPEAFDPTTATKTMKKGLPDLRR
jgi:hypothetical protein